MAAKSEKPHLDELKKKAEALLDKDAIVSGTLSQKDIKAIFHDLKVHQIELQMQNRELAQTQEEAQQAREKYFKLFDQAPVGYISVDDKGIIEKTNQAFCDLIGFDFSNLLYRPLSQFITKKDQDRFIREFRHARDYSGSVKMAIRMLKSNKKGVDTELAVRVMGNASGQADRDEPILIVIIDTEEKVKAQKELEKNQERLKQIIEDIPAMICRFDSDGVITYANNEFSHYFNCLKDTCEGENFFLMLPEDKQALFRRQFARLSKQRPVNTFEFSIADSEEGERYLRWTIRSIFDRNDEVVKFQTVGQDITLLVQTRKEKEEKEKLQNLVELSGAICHELRQPLQILLGQTDLVAMQMAEDETLAEDLERFRKQTLRINQLLTQLDHITRYETKPYTGNSKIIDLDHASERRKHRRYMPKEKLSLQLAQKRELIFPLIDISKGGLSFWSEEPLDYRGKILSGDILDRSGRVLVENLKCEFIGDNQPDVLDALDARQADKTHIFHICFADHNNVYATSLDKLIQEQGLR